MSAHILIVDDEPAIRESLQGLFEDEGYRVTTAPSGEEAVARLRKQGVDCVFLDIWMPGIDGLETLTRIRQIDAQLPVVMMSGHATIDTAVKATRQGAFDFVEKPLSSDKLLILVRNALEKRKLSQENVDLKENMQLLSRQELIGSSKLIKHVRDLIRRVAATDAPVLLLGEHGTGKAIAARQIHTNSRRAQAPFVEVNTASVPDAQMDSELFGHEKGAFHGALHAQRGRFEMANEGLLFLDEIAELSHGVQAKVLRVMQERKVQRWGNPEPVQANVRVVGASAHEPEKLLHDGVLREDFYYRLNVVTIHLPSLRERLEDLPELAEALSAEQAQILGGEPVRFSEAALARMAGHPWAGNVRELRNYIERCHIFQAGSEITPENMPALDGSATVEVATGSGEELQVDHLPGSFHDAKEAFERDFLRFHLERNAWNVSRTAADIGMERSQLHRKIKSFGMKPAE